MMERLTVLGIQSPCTPSSTSEEELTHKGRPCGIVLQINTMCVECDWGLFLYLKWPRREPCEVVTWEQTPE